ncbi:hypothetical protein [Labrys neptuniae]
MTKRILLIDADVVAYNAAFGCEKAIEWEPGYWTWNVDFNDVVQEFDAEVARMMDTLKADEFKLCLTDSEGNFRLDVLPSYKGSRARVRKPIVLKHFKQWLIDERQAYFRPRLEGDDVMGILATWPRLKGEKVIVSIDKDMKTIPGKFIRWGTEDAKVVEISEAEADYWHLYQTLTGDVTDGYKGCPKVGPKAAEKLISFPCAGNGDMWRKHMWEAVVDAFRKAGLGEGEALIQARVARILRATDYNFEKKEPILWEPRKTP